MGEGEGEGEGEGNRPRHTQGVTCTTNAQKGRKGRPKG